MEIENPLKSLKDYSRFVSATLDQPHIKRSTVVVWSDSPFSGTAPQLNPPTMYYLPELPRLNSLRIERGGQGRQRGPGSTGQGR